MSNEQFPLLGFSSGGVFGLSQAKASKLRLVEVREVAKLLDKLMATQYQKLDAPRKWCAAVMHLIKTGLHMASATEALSNLGADAPQRLAKDSQDLLHLVEAANTRKEYRDAFEAVDQMLLDAPTENMGEEPQCEIYNVPVKLFEHYFHLVTYEDCVAHQSQCYKEDLEKDTGMRSMSWSAVIVA